MCKYSDPLYVPRAYWKVMRIALYEHGSAYRWAKRVLAQYMQGEGW